MNAADFRALLKARNHSSFSASPLIGTSPAHIRSMSSGRQKIPSKYLPAIEKLPVRPPPDRGPGQPGKRWSPAEIGRPTPVSTGEARALALAGTIEGAALPQPGTSPRARRRRAQLQRERPLPVFDPVAYNERHPPKRPFKDEPRASILDLVAYVARALPAPWRPPDDPPDGVEGAPMPPMLPAVIPQRPGPGIALAPGVVLPYPDWWRGDLPGQLYGVICAAAVTIREDGGAFVAGHCGRRVDPGSHLCIGHRRIEAASHGVAPMPQSRPLGPSRMQTRPRPPVYS
jgi:hypothetical protein